MSVTVEPEAIEGGFPVMLEGGTGWELSITSDIDIGPGLSFETPRRIVSFSTEGVRTTIFPGLLYDPMRAPAHIATATERATATAMRIMVATTWLTALRVISTVGKANREAINAGLNR